MQTIRWEVHHPSPPPVIRYCKKCGEKKCYHSSGLFRVNAQKKSLTIWLIYKCEVCDTTWNMTILSRVNPQSMNPALLERYHANDNLLAMKSAMDVTLLRQNGAEVGEAEYEVIGEGLPREVVRLYISSDYSCSQRISAILRGKLGLSQKRFLELVENGQIKSENGLDLKKAKLNREAVLVIDGTCLSAINP